MTIKEVSEKYDISADTLRYYERIGMIPEVTRNANGIRNYQKSDLGWVELAICKIIPEWRFDFCRKTSASAGTAGKIGRAESTAADGNGQTGL